MIEAQVSQDKECGGVFRLEMSLGRERELIEAQVSQKRGGVFRLAMRRRRGAARLSGKEAENLERDLPV